MNYLKSALAGFGMSFIGTALCGAKMGSGYWMRNPYVKAKLQLKAQVKDYKSYCNHLKNYQFLSTKIEQATKSGQITRDLTNKVVIKHLESIGEFVLQDEAPAAVFMPKDYLTAPQDSYKEYNVQSKVNSVWTAKNWNVPKSFIINNALCIPAALLGAAYHDYFGRDIADKFNKFFNTDISPYILDGIPFAILGSLGLLSICTMLGMFSELDPFFPLAIAVIQGFVVGCTASLGAYCGDETPKVQTHDELTQNDETQDIDFIL